MNLFVRVAESISKAHFAECGAGKVVTGYTTLLVTASRVDLDGGGKPYRLNIMFVALEAARSVLLEGLRFFGKDLEFGLCHGTTWNELDAALHSFMLIADQLKEELVYCKNQSEDKRIAKRYITTFATARSWLLDEDTREVPRRRRRRCRGNGGSSSQQ